MSDTIVDFPKVTQMLDAGWVVQLFKSDMGSYTAQASHPNERYVQKLRKKLVAELKASKSAIPIEGMTHEEQVDEFDFDDDFLITDDFTPEQALTRLAYKAHGEII